MHSKEISFKAHTCRVGTRSQKDHSQKTMLLFLLAFNLTNLWNPKKYMLFKQISIKLRKLQLMCLFPITNFFHCMESFRFKQRCGMDYKQRFWCVISRSNFYYLQVIQLTKGEVSQKANLPCLFQSYFQVSVEISEYFLDDAEF